MNKLLALLDLFRKGAAVSDPELWKKRQITATILAGLILAVVNTLSTFGYAVPLDVDTANTIAAGVIAIVNLVLTIATSTKVGTIGLKPLESTAIELKAPELHVDSLSEEEKLVEPSRGVPDGKTEVSNTGYLADIYK